MARILIIDDDPGTRNVLADLVLHLGHQAEKDGRLHAGLATLASYDPDLVLLDVYLPDGNGLETISRIQGSPSAPEIIIITGEGSVNGAELAIKNGAWDYLHKPLSLEDVQLCLDRALKYRQGKKAAQGPRLLRRDRIIGKSPALERSLDLVARTAESDVAVLLTGETGTGKEIFARTIHDNSQRARHDFVIVDCANLPASLAESILFGHEKGSFTNADQASSGLIAQAHRGTLFLDEVGELPLGLQKKFLRVLQEQRFRPIGSAREMNSDFRLLAATNRNLDEMATRGLFRRDLLFRMQEVVCELPPLRQRSEDIAELTLTHLAELAHQAGTPIKGLCPGFLETLLAHEWPGNVRELFNAVRTAFVQAGDEPILYDIHLSADIRAHLRRKVIPPQRSAAAVPAHAGMSPGATPSRPWAMGRPLPPLQDVRKAATKELEHEYLTELLRQTDGNMQQACHTSGLSLSQLYRLLRKYQLRA